MKSFLQVVVVLLFATSQAAIAGLYGVHPLEELSEQADEIVIARVVRSGDGVPFVLDILESVAGSVQPGATTEVVVTEPFLTVGQTMTGAHGLWFVVQDGPGWRVLPVASGDITSEDPFYRLQEGADQSLLPLESSFTGANLVLSKLSATPTYGPRDRDRLAAAIAGMDSDAVMRMLRQASTNKDVAVREFGLAGRLDRSDPAAAIELSEEVEAGRLGTSRLAALSMETGYRSSNASGVSALGRIIFDPKSSQELQYAAAAALRGIHSEECLELFSRLMDASDSTLRYAGAFGMAAYANNFPIQTSENVASLGYLSPQPGDWKTRTEETMLHVPSLEDFADDEQKYLNFWRQWRIPQ